MSKSKYFDFDSYVQKDSLGHIIYANRNIGKSSYFLWKGGKHTKSILERYNDFHPDNIKWEEQANTGKMIPMGIKDGKNGRFVYMRTVKNQTDMAVSMLKDLLPNCRINTTSRIIYKPFYAESDKDLENPTWIEVGCVMDLSTSYKTSKSYEFAGYDFVFWDESNEINTRVKQLWFKFMAILKTVQRMTRTLQFVIVGNKDTTNDELMNVFGVKPPKDPTKTSIVTKQELRTSIYIIGSTDFVDLDQSSLLSNMLATLDDTTDGYLNEGHFGYDYSAKVLNYREYVKPTFEPIFKFIYGIDVFYFGRFKNFDLVDEYGNEGRICFYIVRESRTVMWDNLTYISFDNLGGSFEAKSILLDKETLNGFGKMFFFAFKQEILFLNDFDTFEELVPLFTRINLDK